jgi:hypothetical protein
MVLPVLADNDKELLMPPTDGPLVAACQGALRSPSPFPVSTSSAPSDDHAILNFFKGLRSWVLMLEKNVVCSLNNHHVLIIT